MLRVASVTLQPSIWLVIAPLVSNLEDLLKCLHKASAPPWKGVDAARRSFDGYLQVPSACFVQPPLAYVGCTEEEAIQKYSGSIDVYVSKFKPMKNTISGRDERTFMKLLVHADTDQARNSPCISM